MSDEVIDSVNHPLALTISSLLDAAGRCQLQQIIIDDTENILQAVACGVELKMLISTDPDQLAPELKQALAKSLPIITLSKRTGKKLFGANKFSRDFAIATMPQPQKLSSLTACKRDLIVLEDLKISGNIGAIIRTAVALNSSAAVLLSDTAFDIYDRRLIRASRGLLFKLPVVVATAAEFLKFCQANTIKVAVTSSHAQNNIQDIASESSRFAFVFGSEKEGASSQIINAADVQVKIALHNAVESLNVSVAVAIILYLRAAHYTQP